MFRCTMIKDFLTFYDNTNFNFESAQNANSTIQFRFVCRDGYVMVLKQVCAGKVLSNENILIGCVRKKLFHVRAFKENDSENTYEFLGVCNSLWSNMGFKLHWLETHRNTLLVSTSVCKFNMCLARVNMICNPDHLCIPEHFASHKCVLYMPFVVFEWPTYALNCEKLPTCLNTHMRPCEVWNKNSFKLKPSVKFYLKVFSHRFLMELFNKHIVKSVVKILNCCSLLIQTRR